MPDETAEQKASREFIEAQKLADAKAAAEAKVAAAVQAEEAKKHVTMHHTKHGNARVHPTTVKSHQDAGWVLVGP